MKKSKIKQEFEILNSAISSLGARVKELEGSTKQVNEPLSELPEKWAIRVDIYNKDSKLWFNKKMKRNVVWLNGGFAHYPEIQKGLCSDNVLHLGYTEISFSDFERLVLKKGELEVGKWYKSTAIDEIVSENKSIFYITDIDENGNVSAYGFSYKGIWHDNTPDFTNVNRIQDKWKIATKEEVETALIEEAKRRGYKPDGNLFYYNFSFNILYDRYGVGRQIIFNNGQWATIVEEPKQEIDWSVPGQLVVSIHDDSQDLIVQTTGLQKEYYTFCGFVTKENKLYRKGDVSDDWACNEFKMYEPI